MIEADINGQKLVFETSPEVFSPKAVDRGTLMMLEAAAPYFAPGVKVLDIGCGYGAVGIYVAMLCGPENVTMSDICPVSAELAAHNAELNGVSGVEIILGEGFSGIKGAGYGLILSNPPYHADFSVPKEFIEKGFNRLAVGGRMFMVTKRGEWYKNKFKAVFGGVSVSNSGGYFVFMAEKRERTRADKKR